MPAGTQDGSVADDLSIVLGSRSYRQGAVLFIRVARGIIQLLRCVRCCWTLPAAPQPALADADSQLSCSEAGLPQAASCLPHSIVLHLLALSEGCCSLTEHALLLRY